MTSRTSRDRLQVQVPRRGRADWDF